MPVLERAIIACEAALECKLAGNKRIQNRRLAEHEYVWHSARQIVGLVMRSLNAGGFPNYERVAVDWFIADYELALNNQPGSFRYFNLVHGPVNSNFQEKDPKDGVYSHALLLATPQAVKRGDKWLIPPCLPTKPSEHDIKMAIMFYKSPDFCISKKMNIKPYFN